MKKIPIYLVLCTLGFCSVGQGTAFITKSNVLGYSQQVRHYENNPGVHVTYFTDTITGQKGYIGLSDIYALDKYVQICQYCTIKDLAVLGDTAYFCGHTILNKALLGWIELNTLTVYIDSTGMMTLGMTSLDNIEVYYDASNLVRVVGYGEYPSGYVGVDCIIYMGSISYRDTPLPYTPLDMALTDNYIVFAGTLTGEEIVMHPFQKSAVFPPTYAPYYKYAVGSSTVDEPYNNNLRVVDMGDDSVAALTYRLEGGIYRMMLRKFDVSNAFPSFAVPMVSAYMTKFNYSVGNLFDFRYHPVHRFYTVFQNYEVSPTDYHDAVTKINFGSGMPSAVQSDYLAISDQEMKSMSLSDTAMYVVYGYDATSKANVYWKDVQHPGTSGPCLYSDILPIIDMPPVPFSMVDNYCLFFLANDNPVPFAPYFFLERIITICH